MRKMKDKLLYTDITTAIEALALALRRHSGGSMFCRVEVLTRDKDQDDEAPDLYTFTFIRAALTRSSSARAAGYTGTRTERSSRPSASETEARHDNQGRP